MIRRVAVLMGGFGGEAAATVLESRGHRVTRLFAGPGLDRALRQARPEVAFLALHGRRGENGSVQGLLETRGIPYTGSGVLASALATHLPFAKQLFRQHNLPTVPGYTVVRAQLADLRERHGDLGFPCVVKPARGGAALGTQVVRRSSELAAACVGAMRFGGVALVERFVEGAEVTVALLDGRVLGTAEVTEGRTPALSPQRLANVETLATAAYRALGCRGAARADLRIGEVDNDALLEVCTTPDLTPSRPFATIAERAGLAFPSLVERILDLATLDDPASPPLRFADANGDLHRVAG